MDITQTDDASPASVQEAWQAGTDTEAELDAENTGTVEDTGRGHGRSARRRLAVLYADVRRTFTFVVVMSTLVLVALVLPDLWVLLNRPDNDILDYVLSVVLGVFVIDIAVQAMTVSRFCNVSFFFWMDALAALSLTVDISYIRIGSILAEAADRDGSLMVVRMGRLATLAPRAGRFARMVKLLRFLMRIAAPFKHFDGNTAKLLTARLSTSVSLRISFLIIAITVLMPVFAALSYPMRDRSMQTWVDNLEVFAIHYPTRFDAYLDKFHDFYQSRDIHPWQLTAKNGANFTAIGMLLPWKRADGPPHRIANSERYESALLSADFDFSSPNKIDSIVNLSVIAYIMIMIFLFTLTLSNTVSKVVLHPIGILVGKVGQMRRMIFQSVAADGGDFDADNDYQNDEGSEQTFSLEKEARLLTHVVNKLQSLRDNAATKPGGDVNQIDGMPARDRAVVDGLSASARRMSVWGARSSHQEDALPGADEDLACNVAENAGLSLELLNSWSFNALELDKARNAASVTYFLDPFNHGIKIDSNVLSRFTAGVEESYQSVPFHSWHHAVDVTHSARLLLQTCSCDAYLSSLDRLGLIVSAVCHDAGHPGWNNNFLIAANHELALRYNDKAPLENMHCTVLFSLANSGESNVFGSLTRDQYQEVRRICIEAILHTDSQQHFEIIKQVRMLTEEHSEILLSMQDAFGEEPTEFPNMDVVDCFRQPPHRRLLVILLMVLSDVSYTVRPFRISRMWSMQALEEMFLQGDEEKRLGLPVQAMNDRDFVNKPFSQIGFIEFLVAPLVFTSIMMLPPSEPLADQLVVNVKTWHQQWFAETHPAPSEEEERALENRIVLLEQRYHQCHS
jgi:hypothetical protein